MKVELVVNEGLRMPLSYEMLESLLRHFEVDDRSVTLLEALAEHPAKDVRVALAGKDHLSESAFRILFATRDFYVIQELLGNASARPYFSKDVLAGLISQSEFAYQVAGSLEDFPNADEGIADSLARHPDPYVRNMLAGNYRAPKRLLRVLSDDADPAVARSAKGTLD
ncbi:MAG TPA: hypothetical protein PLC55_14705 [Zoogloea sp.]|nr:hypothetical protein [Zoogloea sp.]